MSNPLVEIMLGSAQPLIVRNWIQFELRRQLKATGSTVGGRKLKTVKPTTETAMLAQRPWWTRLGFRDEGPDNRLNQPNASVVQPPDGSPASR